MRRLVILVALAACGAPPAEEQDAGNDPTPDPNTLPCDAPEPMGALDALTDGEAVIDLRGDDEHFRIDYNGRLGGTEMLRLQLLEGAGAFAEGLAPGEYAIGGDDADVASCGLCTFVITRYYEPAAWQFLLAQSGTITFERVDRVADGRLVGTASGLALTRVVYKNGRWMLQDGCTTTLESVRFDVPLKPGPFFPMPE
jgi:hypothetical protein